MLKLRSRVFMSMRALMDFRENIAKLMSTLVVQTMKEELNAANQYRR